MTVSMQHDSVFVDLRPIFDALAQIFLEPETLGAADAIPIAAQTLLEVGKNLPDNLKVRLSQIEDKKPATDLELSQSYAKLFLDVATTAIPLCESAWADSEHLLSRRAQFECRDAYQDAGLELAGGSVVPEDHLGLMLGFLAVMALRDDVQIGMDFYKRHLQLLIPAISQAIDKQKEGAGAYADVAVILDGIVAVLKDSEKSESKQKQ